MEHSTAPDPEDPDMEEIPPDEHGDDNNSDREES